MIRVKGMVVPPPKQSVMARFREGKRQQNMFTDDISIVEENLPVKATLSKTLLRNENTQSMKLPRHSVKQEASRDSIS